MTLPTCPSFRKGRGSAALKLAAACAATLAAACSRTDAMPAAESGDAGDAAYPVTLPSFIPAARVFVDGDAYNDLHRDCRSEMCRHSENTDLIRWGGALWLVHRSAISQTLGPNSALHVYRSDDDGQTFVETALIDAPTDRDIRDPCFYVVGQTLFLKALTRVPSLATHDTGVDTVTVAMQSTDGAHWSSMQPIAPAGWSFWRVKEQDGVFYSAAYEDGDRRVVLFRSSDGINWTFSKTDLWTGPLVYGVSADAPLETELTFLPSGKLLALVRMDGTDAELLGDSGRLRTKICWSDPPYFSFSCPQEFEGQRLDGARSFLWQGRLLVVARRHLQPTDKKRTSLFEIGGHLEGGPLTIREWGELPSAGDTSYAGVAMLDDTRALVSWYSSDLGPDQGWVLAMFEQTSIWLGTLDLTKLR